MSNTVARIMLSLVTFFISKLIFIVIAYILSEYYYYYEMGYVFASFPAGIFVFTAWILIWHKPKLWNLHKLRQLVFAILGSIACGILLTSLLLLVFLPTEQEFALSAGSLFTLLCSLVALILIIKETPAERAHRLRSIGFIKIVCPACNYDMRGLHTTDCPECGQKC